MSLQLVATKPCSDHICDAGLFTSMSFLPAGRNLLQLLIKLVALCFAMQTNISNFQLKTWVENL